MEEIDKEGLLTCTCGSILFSLEKAVTLKESAYFIHFNKAATITGCDSTIPYSRCIACGKIYLPRCSYAGFNILDRVVKVQKELYDLSAEINSDIDKNIARSEAWHTHVVETLKSVEEVVENVEAERDSILNTQDDVQSSGNRGRSKKNNKE